MKKILICFLGIVLCLSLYTFGTNVNAESNIDISNYEIQDLSSSTLNLLDDSTFDSVNAKFSTYWKYHDNLVLFMDMNSYTLTDDCVNLSVIDFDGQNYNMFNVDYSIEILSHSNYYYACISQVKYFSNNSIYAVCLTSLPVKKTGTGYKAHLDLEVIENPYQYRGYIPYLDVDDYHRALDKNYICIDNSIYSESKIISCFKAYDYGNKEIDLTDDKYFNVEYVSGPQTLVDNAKNIAPGEYVLNLEFLNDENRSKQFKVYLEVFDNTPPSIIGRSSTIYIRDNVDAEKTEEFLLSHLSVMDNLGRATLKITNIQEVLSSLNNGESIAMEVTATDQYGNTSTASIPVEVIKNDGPETFVSNYSVSEEVFNSWGAETKSHILKLVQMKHSDAVSVEILADESNEAVKTLLIGLKNGSTIKETFSVIKDSPKKEISTAESYKNQIIVLATLVIFTIGAFVIIRKKYK